MANTKKVAVNKKQDKVEGKEKVKPSMLGVSPDLPEFEREEESVKKDEEKDEEKSSREDFKFKEKRVVSLSSLNMINPLRQQQPLGVGVVILKSTGDFVTYISSPFDIAKIDNAIYEWNGDKEHVFTIISKDRRYPANFFFEGNPRAQPLRLGLEKGLVIEAYQDRSSKQLLDGRNLLDKLELTSLRLSLFDKSSKQSEGLLTEDNVKWLWIVIGIVAVIVVIAVMQSM